jgi:cytochrome c oxidase cbb3-type subunit II
MKNGPLFVVGLFAALTVSWAGMVLGTQAQLGKLTPYFDENEGQSFPQRTSGIATQGQLVYNDLGCAACHTQQVRRPGFGSDQARGWGERQSVARDYIFQIRPQLGSFRHGPDLTNLAVRKPNTPDAASLMKLLYTGEPMHPPYRFLFDTQKIVGERSDRALTFAGRFAPASGYEIIPSRRAEALVAYLLSLNASYEYPEAHPAAPETTENAGEAGKAPASAAPAAAAKTEPSPETEKSNPPGKRPEQAVPAAAPDEKKKSEEQKK